MPAKFKKHRRTDVESRRTPKEKRILLYLLKLQPRFNIWQMDLMFCMCIILCGIWFVSCTNMLILMPLNKRRNANGFSVCCRYETESRLQGLCFLLVKLCYNLENIQKLLKLVYTFLRSVYGIKIGLARLQICIWVKSCLNNWQESNTKTTRHLQVKKSPHRPRNSTLAPLQAENLLILFKISWFYFMRTKLLPDVMFWTFSNWRILELNYEAFEKFRKPLKSLLLFK